PTPSNAYLPSRDGCCLGFIENPSPYTARPAYRQAQVQPKVLVKGHLSIQRLEFARGRGQQCPVRQAGGRVGGRESAWLPTRRARGSAARDRAAEATARRDRLARFRI